MTRPEVAHEQREEDMAAGARTRILDAATALLADSGLRSLTQPRISRRCGLRQSHLTYYFPTRRDLMIGIAQHSMEALSRPLVQKARLGKLTASTLARTLVDELVNRGRIRVMLWLMTAAEEDAMIASAVHELVGRIRSRIAELFGSLGYRTDAQTLAVAHTLMVGAAVLHHGRTHTTADRETRLIVDWVSRGLPNNFIGTSYEKPVPRIATERRSRS